MSGLLALLDDVAAIVKLAAAQLDDMAITGSQGWEQDGRCCD